MSKRHPNPPVPPATLELLRAAHANRHPIGCGAAVEGDAHRPWYAGELAAFTDALGADIARVRRRCEPLEKLTEGHGDA